MQYAVCFSCFIGYSQPRWITPKHPEKGALSTFYWWEKRGAEVLNNSPKILKQGSFRGGGFFFLMFTPAFRGFPLKTINEFNMWDKRPGCHLTNALTVPALVIIVKKGIWNEQFIRQDTWEMIVSNWQGKECYVANSFENNHLHNLASQTLKSGTPSCAMARFQTKRFCSLCVFVGWCNYALHISQQMCAELTNDSWNLLWAHTPQFQHIHLALREQNSQRLATSFHYFGLLLNGSGFLS